MYADDLVIFCHANTEEANHLKLCLNQFSVWSGQIINIDKSVIHFGGNVFSRKKNDILQILGMIECIHKQKHLGLPFCKPPSKSVYFQETIDKIGRKLSGWKLNSLSQASRSVLLKSVIQAIPIYPMSTFCLPVSTCNSIDKLMRCFWWGKDPSKKSLFLKKWEDICLPKSEGGLGFRQMRDINRALIAKLGWNILNNDNKVWVDIFKAKYFRNQPLLELESYPVGASWIFRDIFACKNLLLKGLCFHVSPHDHTRIWIDPWIPSIDGFIPPKPLLSDSVLASYYYVKKLFLPDTSSWNLEVLNLLFPLPVVQAILKIKCSASSAALGPFGSPSNNGRFSVKSTYLTDQKSRFPPFSDRLVCLCKLVWKSKLHPRFKLFLWRIIMGVIPTKDRLDKKISVGDTSCIFCHQEPDSLEHLFIRCPVAQQVWLVSRWNFRLLLFEHCRIDEWLRILLTFDRQLFPSLDLCWEFLTFSLAENLAIEHVKAQRAKILCSQECILVQKWKPPPSNWLKVNTDASFKDGKVAAALLVRNSFGAVVFAAAFSDWCHNVVVAEAFAIAKALLILDKTGYQQVLFESDSLLEVNMILHDSIPSDWAAKVDIEAAKVLLIRRPFWQICNISRLRN
ncbi:hypothetical protein BUALT_Bualt07G0040600 [Buddleja alternifolia]|uniref:Reverse transcriptase n=1 Tax=Buddleja alternifolia TaxID=168488 RepID=A0AAV6X8X8_9LAMI|nr:hypothetical protein BUALT_Bualt07G0040600 [Buddleja alternifolia]